MKQTIQGGGYEFIINCYKHKGKYCFYIEAISLKKQTHSFINNMNCILSELNTDINNKKTGESQWNISEKKAKLFFTKAIDFISNSNYRNYLEKNLNVDRELGEWNNIK